MTFNTMLDAIAKVEKLFYPDEDKKSSSDIYAPSAKQPSRLDRKEAEKFAKEKGLRLPSVPPKFNR